MRMLHKQAHARSGNRSDFNMACRLARSPQSSHGEGEGL